MSDTMNGSNMNTTLLTNGMGMTLKNGSLEGEAYSAETLRAMAEANSAAGIVPAYSYTTESSEQTAQVQFDIRDSNNFNGTADVAATPAQYIEALVDSIDATFNGDYFKESVRSTGLNVEFKPARTEPTPVIIHQMKDASVVIDRATRFISLDSAGLAPDTDERATGTLEAGAEIHIKPAKKALVFSASTKAYDFSLMGSGFTEGSIHTTLSQLIKDVNLSLGDNLVDILDDAEATRRISVAPLKPSRSMAEIAENILDVIRVQGKRTGFSDKLSEMALIVPVGVESALEALATKNGFSGDTALQDMLGAHCFSYRDMTATGAIYIVPKALCVLSWRSMKDGSGDLFKIEVTRDAPRQAWTIEILSVIDIMAEAFTTYKGDTGEESDYFDSTGIGTNPVDNQNYSQLQTIIRLDFNGQDDFVGIPGVTQNPPLKLTQDLPATQEATVGDDVTFATAASGGVSSISYKWEWKGATGDWVEIDPNKDPANPNPTATTAVLVNHAVTKASAGSYRMTATDGTTTVTSAVCVLTVKDAAPVTTK